MNVRQIIREAIADLVTIDQRDIESAIMELDLTSMITNAVAEQLPEAIKELVEEELEEIVSDAIESALD